MTVFQPGSIIPAYIFDGYGGTSNKAQVDSSGHLQVDIQDGTTVQVTYADDAALDAFSRLRVASPQTLFDCKQLVDNQPLLFDDQQTSGSGTTSSFVTNQAVTQMSVSNLTAGTRVRQTFQRMNYQPGKGIACYFTGVLGAKHTGIKKRIGYFDGYNGVFFELNATDFRVVTRTYTSGSVVDGYVTQANFNLDKLDGTGPSGITLDTTKTQIFFLDFQWLGVGRVRLGINVNGQAIHCHQFLNANNLTLPYMSNPNLPVRYEISNDGTGPVDSLYHICSSVISEGGNQGTGISFTADTGATGLTTGAATSIFPILALRLKSAYQMATIDPTQFNILCSTNVGFRTCLLLNPTVAGTAMSFSDITNSALQLATPSNATTVSAGTLLYSTFGWGATGAGNSVSALVVEELQNNLRIGANIAGVSDIIVLGVQPLTATASTFNASLVWSEKN
jgi:hypothetical protein